MTGLRVALLALALLHVSVAQEPTLQVLPSNILKPLGDRAYVSCSAVVDNPELVTEMQWSGPNGQEIPNAEGTIIALESIEGSGKLDLMIQNLREEDSGEYECTAVYAGNQKLSVKLMVDFFVDIDFGDTPVVQTPIINEESKIRCNPKSKPPPQVDWLKDLLPLKSDGNLVIQQDGVLIKKVSEADEGTYRCRARVPELGSIDFRDIQVEVHIPPSIDKRPVDEKGVEKASVTFECGATGKPAPTYSWVNKDNTPLEGVEGYYVDTEKGVLTIMDLRPDHTGRYRCTAENPAGADTADATLQVLTKPKVEQYLNVTQEVDSDLEMRCVATGDPMPKIIFQKFSNDHPFTDGINNDDRIEVVQTEDDQGRRVGILKIRGVVRADDGLYTCTATSEGGETQVWGHITVEFMPTFEDQVRDVEWSWQQQPVNLTCIATAIPNATIQWYLRNSEIDKEDPNLEVLSFGPVGVLRVTPVRNEYYGDYACEATNRLGMKEFDIKLKEAHVPGPVASAKVQKKTATTITWNIVGPVDDGGLPVLGYLVEYRMKDLPWDNAVSHYWTKDQTYTLDKLQPLQTYVFRFAARSEVGEGEWSGEKEEQMPHISVPEEPLIFDVEEGVTAIPYPNKFTLRWQPPLDNGEPIDLFQIMYYQVQNASGQWESIGTKNAEEVEYPATVYTITGLRSSTFYKIELRAHNAIGFSTPAEAVIKTAHGNDEAEASTASPGVGLIAGIVVIAVLVIVVIADLTCYCTNNAGLTAAVLGKRGVKDKDKEAMLEDGKNARRGSNRKSKVQVSEVDVKTLNAQDQRQRRQQTYSQHNPVPINMQFMGQSGEYERSQNVRARQPQIVKAIMKNNSQNQSAYGPSGRPCSMAMALENPVFRTGSSMKSSSSTPILDHETSSDSIYDVPFLAQHARPPIHSPETPKPRPPLPARNPDTRLTLGGQSQSHDRLLNHVQESSTDTFYEDHPSYYGGPGTSYNMLASREALNQAPRPPYNISASREALNQAPRPPYNMSASREALNQAPRPPYNMSASREALNQAPRPPYNMSASREALNQAPRPSDMSLRNGTGSPMLSSNSSHSGIYETISSPRRSPSQSSLSTLYQPVQNPHYDAKPKTAFEIAPYDDPVSPSSARRPVAGREVQPKPMPRLPGQPSGHTFSPNASAPPNVQPPIRPSVPPPAPPPSTENKEDKKPLKTVTTLLFRERPQQQNHSQSMDNLDAAYYPSQQDSQSSTTYSPQSIDICKISWQLVKHRFQPTVIQTTNYHLNACMLMGEKDDKEEILKEEQKEEEEKLKKSESKSSVTKDSPV
ncbi:fasciclin-2-like isoform X13 [Penaeus monodon]|uniref:fasciclin-2-like isoform X13 n=1 Tax=Penaeus monodon TaxID=6687 RepID=UPI0018A76681|nr:fasciclin-2-like isoform X13 [Penaeus monodon]XP_037784982.1 fasciclin-2-like isoform X13 [Penaeus monodon]XP_037784983.1 fasciclin-2-like isoform X13 [Penaeus monodon]